MMKTYKFLFIFLTGYCFIYASCGDLSSYSLPVYTFNIENNTTDTFKYSYSISFPDSSIPLIKNDTLIYPGMNRNIEIPKYLFPNFEKTGTIEIFLFNVDTLNSYSWNTIISKYLIAKRYDLTFDCLTKLNNTIVYP